jgi:arylsulfatase A-like enzyme
MVTRMDENVGRLLRVLTELNLDRNTIVVFTSAQGFATGENGMWGTGPLFWDTFIRCPLLVRLPQSANAERTPIKQLVSSVDLAPTLLEAAGLPVPPLMQGRSLLTLARNGVDPDRPNECFAESDVVNGQSFPARALIADAYKLVDYLQEPDATDQFYSLKRDPGEEQNLVTDPVYSPLVKVMRARLDHWRKRTSDPTMR